MAIAFVLNTLKTGCQQGAAVAIPHLNYTNVQACVMNGMAKGAAYATAHPYSTGVTVLNLALAPILGVGWIAKFALYPLGFTPLGPAAGSVAAWYQATFLGAYIPANGLFRLGSANSNGLSKIAWSSAKCTTQLME